MTSKGGFRSNWHRTGRASARVLLAGTNNQLRLMRLGDQPCLPIREIQERQHLLQGLPQQPSNRSLRLQYRLSLAELFSLWRK